MKSPNYREPQSIHFSKAFTMINSAINSGIKCMATKGKIEIDFEIVSELEWKSVRKSVTKRQRVNSSAVKWVTNSSRATASPIDCLNNNKPSNNFALIRKNYYI